MAAVTALAAVAAVAAVTALGPLGQTLRAAEKPTVPAVELRDFDHDGVLERVVSEPGRDEIQRRKPGAEAWEKDDFNLPEGVYRIDAAGRDAGLRFIDLNGDGFEDVFFSNADRIAIHLWNKDVKPHLGWTRGWSQFVRSGRRTGASNEPPSLVGSELRREGSELVVYWPAAGGRLDRTERLEPKRLIAFDMTPPRSPEEALTTMRVPAGFRVELVAAEPVVVDPVALDFGPDGRLWVAEMRDYPLGMNGRGKPGGVVKTLVDADGDGRYEKAIPFLEGLPFPSSVMAWRKGVIIAAAPEVFYAEDTDGDGRADVRRTLLTGFVEGNQQHRVNGFEWGLDGWIYAANGDSGGKVRSEKTGQTLSISGRDLRFRPDTGELETVSVQTQYQRRRDDWGHWFGNNNPTWLWHVTIPEHYLRRNPKVAVKRVMKVLANYEDSTRVFPVSPPMVRPNQPWSLNHVTSGSCASPYRDDLFGTEFADSIFICEPVHNTLHREVLVRDGSGFSSRRAAGEEKSEFLASTDNWFRPTMVRTGPDGALYIADMYRFVLEHPEWISLEMQARLDLRAGDDRGRLYRIVPEGKPRRAMPDLTRLGSVELVAALDHPGGWQRDHAQRLLVDRRDVSAPVVGGLERLLSVTHAPQVRIQALSTLGLLGVLKPDRLAAVLADPHPWVRCEALRQAEVFSAQGEPVLGAVLSAVRDGDAAVRLQAAFSLGAWAPDLSEGPLRELAERAESENDELLRTAVMSSLRPESPLFAAINTRGVRERATVAGPVLRPSSPDRAAVIASYAGVERLEGRAVHGKELFVNLCAPCHRLRDEGHEVGPDLAMVASKDVPWLLLAILDPSQAVEARYRAWTLTPRNAEPLDGLVSAETANNLVIRVAGGTEHAVLRSDIKALEPRKGSLMPDGFETALKPQDMADLIAWMRGPGR
jgi:putative membrane-bound dehydrogenase-like protein